MAQTHPPLRIWKLESRILAVWVQKALARRGYYHGPIDGVIGKSTRRAIRGYRADYGLPVSSRIDYELLKALG